MGSIDLGKRAVAYSRVSTILHGQDPELQLSAIRSHAQTMGFTLVDEYVDYVSGTKERRPSLDRLIADAKRGRFKVLIVTGIDRIGRNTRHLLNLIAELSEYGVGIISLREGLNFTTSVGKATLGILAVVAELEVDLTKERIRTAMAQKKLAAELAGLKWKCGRPTVKTSDNEKQVFELHSKGTSSRDIAKIVGVSKSSVQRILRAGSKGAKKSELQVIENTSDSSRNDSGNPVSQNQLVLTPPKRDDKGTR